MLTINGKTITVGTLGAAQQELAPSLDPPPQQGTQEMNLLRTIVFLAVQQEGETFTEKNVIGAYKSLIGQAYARARAKKDAREVGKQIFGSPENTEVRIELNSLFEALQGKIQELEEGDQVVLFRGVDPIQALSILKHKTFGGLAPAASQSGAPTAQDASRQSGENVKQAEGGLIEEWSLAPQTGYATGGFMLIALTHPSKVNLPNRGHSRVEGERGVVGFADHSLTKVAIYDAGRDFEGLSAESLEADMLTKRVSREKAIVLEALRDAG